MNQSVQAWATAISTHSGNGRKLIWRSAQDFRPEFDLASQPDRIILVWKYDSETGQPMSEEHQRMNVFEDDLEQIVEEGRFSTLALVSTGEGLREWIYYAKNSEEFIERLNMALEGQPEYPIEIYAAADPTWNTYRVFRGGVKGLTSERLQQ